MENFAQSLRESTIDFLKGNQINDEYKIYVDKFLYYTGAYCAELKSTTIDDILNNDKTYNMIFNLFNSVILKNQLSLEIV